MFIIYYGVEWSYLDISHLALEKCLHGELLIIPASEAERNYLFGDPKWGFQKCIKVIINEKTYIYNNQGKAIFLYKNGTLKVLPALTHNYLYGLLLTYNDHYMKLDIIHQYLKIKYGIFKNKYSEQAVITRFIKGHEHVLELGSNIGRNSLVIASLLNNDQNLVTLECNPSTYLQCVYNRDLNDYNFHVERSALSKRALYYLRNETFAEKIPNSKSCEIISFDFLQQKYNIQFNTLVANCGEALYYIFLDEPNILDKIRLLIVKNNFQNVEEKRAVDNILVAKKFKRVYVEDVIGAQNCNKPCKEFFYEAWKKMEGDF